MDAGSEAAPDGAVLDWISHLDRAGETGAATRCRALALRAPSGRHVLPGPVGEENVYALHPRGTVLCVPLTPLGLAVQVGAALATGNEVVVRTPADMPLLARLPDALARHVREVPTGEMDLACHAVLFEGDGDGLLALDMALAHRKGPLVAAHGLSPAELAAGADYPLEWLLHERVVSTNTAAAGGNASLMTLAPS